MADDLLPDITETILEPRSTRVQFGTPDVFPQLFTFTGEDVLELTAWSAASGVRLTMQGRILGTDGIVVPFTTDLAPTSDRAQNTKIHTLPQGTLLNVVVFCSTGSPRLGQVYTRVAVLRGAGPASTRLGVLIGGLVTATQHLGFPGSPIRSALESEPCAYTVIGTNPALGVDITETVPTGARWELLTMHGILVVGAAGGPSTGYLYIDDGTNVYYSTFLQAAAGINTTNEYYVGQNLPYRTDPSQPGPGNSMLHPLPPLRLLAGHRIRMNNNNNIANKDWGSPIMNVREWLEVP